MSLRKAKVDALEKRLYAAYGSAPAGSPGAGWRESVMREVRARAASPSGERAQAFVESFAWRFSAAAAVVALLLLVYIFTNGVVDYQELAMRYFENPIEFLM
jgi:hypothetical protein